MAPQTLYRVEDGVAIVTLSNPPVNALHPDVLRSLFENMKKAHSDSSVRAIVIIGDKGRFCAGFDISQFQKSSAGGIGDEINDSFVRFVEAGPKPTVAAVSALALGGGCELALACNARVATPGTSFGLPELTLGILPGFGGTQRLPRVVGLEKGLQMILTSKPIKDAEALKLGLVEAVVPPQELLSKAKSLALDIAAGRAARVNNLERTDKLPSVEEAVGMLAFAKQATAKRARNLTHPLLMIDAVEAGIRHGGAAGLRAEVGAFKKAASLPTHKALVHVFFAQRTTKKVAGVTDRGLEARPVRHVAVLGGGLMGSGIATASALAGIKVLLKEVDQKFLDDGLGRIRSNLESAVRRKRLSQKAMEAAMSRVEGTLTYDKFKSVDMVIEAAIERVDLKQQIFADLERACGPDCILATNTSTIDISVVGAKTNALPRIVGAHFFSPAHVMPLLEIVRTSKTSAQVVLDVLQYGAAIKKTPVVVGNCTGFAVNRVFFPYTQAALLLADLGADPYQVDEAVAAWGMPMGPFRLSDLVGADVGLHVGKSFLDSFPGRVYASQLFSLQNEAKRLGEKTKLGFYAYDDRRKAAPSPQLPATLAESRRRARLRAPGLDPARFSAEDVVEFVLFPVVNEACRVIDERIVDKAADLDVATVMAMGFPAYRGGLVHWADHVGARRIASRLDAWAAQFAASGLEGFFKPCEYLAAAARDGTALSAGRPRAKH